MRGVTHNVLNAKIHITRGRMLRFLVKAGVVTLQQIWPVVNGYQIIC
jgi:hypothetical protein